MVESRLKHDWNQTAHIMAAAFWSQGHEADPCDLNPMTASKAVLPGEPVSLPFPATRHDIVPASEIRVED